MGTKNLQKIIGTSILTTLSIFAIGGNTPNNNKHPLTTLEEKKTIIQQKKVEKYAIVVVVVSCAIMVCSIFHYMQKKNNLLLINIQVTQELLKIDSLWLEYQQTIEKSSQAWIKEGVNSNEFKILKQKTDKKWSECDEQFQKCVIKLNLLKQESLIFLKTYTKDRQLIILTKDIFKKMDNMLLAVKNFNQIVREKNNILWKKKRYKAFFDSILSRLLSINDDSGLINAKKRLEKTTEELNDSLLKLQSYDFSNKR